MWGNQLNSRPPAEKMGVRGKLACATYTQTQVYLKPLLRKLKTKTLPEDISDSLTEITRYMLDRDYIQVCRVYVLFMISVEVELGYSFFAVVKGKVVPVLN
jgi:pre-mRNA-splicing factor 18